MQTPIGNYNVFKEGQGVGLGTAQKLPYGRSKTFHFRGMISASTGTAVFQALGSNIPNPTTLGDYFPIGSPVTLNLVATGRVSALVESSTPCLWVNVSMTSISANGQAECWISA